MPRISNLQFIPDRVTAGCPVTIRFHFEDPDGDVVRARGHWRLQQSNKTVESRSVTLPIDPGLIAGKIKGEASARVTFERYGTYWYYVQVEDATGHKSNVLREAILVDAPLPWSKMPEACE